MDSVIDMNTTIGVREPSPPSPVVELRQYTLKPGQRDTLAALFERKFVAGQEALGIRLHGEFRDMDDPDRFVWLRGFAGMEERPRLLGAFYYGDVWKANREVANATMLDSDNVLLLKPVGNEGFSLARRMSALMVVTVYLLRAPVDDGFIEFFSQRVKPVMEATGAPPLAELRTDGSPNNFPALPIREGEHAFVWFAGYGSRAEYERHLALLSRSKLWDAARAELASRLASPPAELRLEPTAGALARNAPRYVYSASQTGGVHDFDFIAGSWEGVSRRLAQRGVNSFEWESFPVQTASRQLLGGRVNVDETIFPTKGWSGMTVRTFVPATRQWMIYWINSLDGKLQSPVAGGFQGDVGLFYGEDVDAGRPVKAAFKWTRMGHNAARWEQAFSYDGGTTWETNWVMELQRRER